MTPLRIFDGHGVFEVLPFRPETPKMPRLSHFHESQIH